MRAIRICLFVSLVLVACGGAEEKTGDFPVPAIAWAPRSYSCPRAEAPPFIDGKLDDDAWKSGLARWTDDFGDITGDAAKPPRFRTRAKLLWDDEYLYLGVEMEEPHVWGSLTERDCVVYFDNDIELFLDPDGDTHEYYEVEMNALNTVWDLLVTKPYRDDGHGVNAWDVRGIRTAVHVDGTLNDPTDTDRGWSVEMAIPWGPLRESECTSGPPAAGDVWRVNLSRVEWRTKVVDGKYVKETDPTTGKPLPEDNWSWSPQGLVAMHYPEMWGYLVFAGDRPGKAALFDPGPVERAKQVLRGVYYAEKRHRAGAGRYAARLAELPPGVILRATRNQFEAELTLDDGRTLYIDHDGRTWIPDGESE